MILVALPDQHPVRRIGMPYLAPIEAAAMPAYDLKELASREGLVAEFDEELWYATVDHVAVYEDKRMSVRIPPDPWPSGHYPK